MAAFEAALSVSSLYYSSFSSYSSKFFASPKPSTSLKLHISNSIPPISRNFLFSSPPCILNNPARKPFFELMCSAVQEVTAEEEAVEEKAEETQTQNLKRKLYVVNLPWSLTVVDIKNLFGECGTVTDVEIIKQPNGKSRGFAFVTMASGEEAQAVIEKFHSHEVLDRTIRVEFAKQFKKPSPPPPNPQIVETRYKLYVSNLGWKVRSSHLRDFVSENFKVPVSARVVFSGPSGKSGGYGFLSFATKEEAESAISSLNGMVGDSIGVGPISSRPVVSLSEILTWFQSRLIDWAQVIELMGRPLNLKFSEKNVSDSGSQKDEEEKFEGQPE